jgi:outer membrane receptor for ferrienterochelin and colicin
MKGCAVLLPVCKWALRARVLALALTGASLAAAAASSPGEGDDLFTLSLDELARITVVTASKAPQPLEESPFSVTVLTADRIRNFAARNIYDVLAHVPGLRIDLTNRGRPVVEVRGVWRETTDYLLFLLDGHPLNEPANGSATFLFDLSRLPVQNIERIEVVRGPGSAVYGNHAFLGMVNIITRSADSIDGTELSVRDEFEADGNIGQEYNLLHGHRFGEQTTLALNMNLIDRNGEDVDIDPDAAGRSEKADTRFEQFDLQGQLEHGRLRITGRYTHQDRGDFVGAVNLPSSDSGVKFDAGFLDARLGLDPTPEIDASLRAYADYLSGSADIVVPGETLHPNNPFRATGVTSKLSMDVAKAGVQAQVSFRGINNHVITLGADFEYQEQDNLSTRSNEVSAIGDSVSSPRDVTEVDPFGEDADRTWFAVFAEDSWQIRRRLHLNAGLRYDNYSDFGDSLNPRLGLKWGFVEAWDLRLTYGTAFRAPDFRSLFLISPLTSGNPDLREEKVTSYEVGIAGTPWAGLRTGLTWFHNNLKDLIAVPPSGTRFDNIQEVRAQGAEMEARYDIDASSYIAASYTYTDSNLEDGSPYPGVPYHSGNLLLSKRLRRDLNAALAWYWQGDSPRALDDRRDDLAGFDRVDVSLVYSGFGGHLGLELAVYNLLDENYAYPAPQGTLPNDYPASGRSFMLGLRFRP